jgi:hypothetical protein
MKVILRKIGEDSCICVRRRAEFWIKKIQLVQEDIEDQCHAPDLNLKFVSG